jgi:hypothetical protein
LNAFASDFAHISLRSATVYIQTNGDFFEGSRGVTVVGVPNVVLLSSVIANAVSPVSIGGAVQIGSLTFPTLAKWELSFGGSNGKKVVVDAARTRSLLISLSPGEYTVTASSGGYRGRVELPGGDAVFRVPGSVTAFFPQAGIVLESPSPVPVPPPSLLLACDLTLGNVVISENRILQCSGRMDSLRFAWPLTVSGSTSVNSIIVSDSFAAIQLQDVQLRGPTPFFVGGSELEITIVGQNRIESAGTGIECSEAEISLESVSGGRLVVAGRSGPGLGVDGNGRCSQIDLRNAIVNASGSVGIGSGIARGQEASLGRLEISGSRVVAVGTAGPGIGAGSAVAGGRSIVGELTIVNSTVNASGRVAIGAGEADGGSAICQVIRIAGGQVLAKSSEFGPGIGAGPALANGTSRVTTLVIERATVVASGTDGPGIGAHLGRSILQNLTISGGNVTAIGQQTPGIARAEVLGISNARVTTTGLSVARVRFAGKTRIFVGNGTVNASSITLSNGVFVGQTHRTRLFATPPVGDGLDADFVILYGRPTAAGAESLSGFQHPFLQIGNVTFSTLDTFRVDIHGPSGVVRSFDLDPSSVLSFAASLPGPGNYSLILVSPTHVGRFETDVGAATFAVGERATFYPEARIDVWEIPAPSPSPGKSDPGHGGKSKMMLIIGAAAGGAVGLIVIVVVIVCVVGRGIAPPDPPSAVQLVSSGYT